MLTNPLLSPTRPTVFDRSQFDAATALKNTANQSVLAGKQAEKREQLR